MTQPSAAPLVLAFGDSLTAGYGLRPAQAFPARLETHLRERWSDARVLNAGVSGDTTGSALRRLPGVLSRLERRPDLAIVELGANDLLRGLAAAQTRANLDAILRELRQCGIPVLLATFAVPPMLQALAGGYATIYADIAAAYGVPSWPFFPPGVLGHREMVLPDRIHPNAAAIERVASAMAPEIIRLLTTRAVEAA
jgi:acyl-CoA thioesterase-1